ncbi:chemotaxis protein CheA [Bdellovibrio sp. HCB337]|uniref:chemotaxis protein CheA n=1 Tax=Bdellovibrio sp. HCB337 TaxID=3394358 RepID=UPI0039A6C3BC
MSDSENKKSSAIIELDFDFSEVQNVSEAFFKESEEILSDLDEHILRLENQAHDEILLQSLFRKVHTLKGSVGAVPGGQLFGSLSHEFETLLDRLRKQKIQPNTECIEIFLHSSRLLKILAESLRTHREIYPEELSEAIELISRYGSFQLTASIEETPRRVLHSEAHDEDKKQNKDGIWLSKEQMSSLMELSSEFIILKNSVQTLTSSKETLSMQKMLEKQNSLSQSLNALSDQFQNILDKAQKTPLKEAFSGLSPLIRQAAYELKKEVQVIEEGWELEVDKALAQDLYKSLIHMVRNALDHGIEKPEDRTQAGKSAQGTLKIHVEEKSSVIHCEISDDGRGLDKDRILQRALEKGLTNSLEASQLSEEKIFAFIFHPGFSTKEKITTMSGRGVGMDVVQNMVTSYGGSIDIQSTPGQGARIQLNIPVPKNLLIERCLLGEWQEFAFAFPLSQVSHISSCDELQVTEVDQMRFCQFENRTVPLLTVEEVYKFRTSLALEKVKTMSVVFLKFENFTLGMLVDKIQHQADLVIKSFGTLIKKVPGFKGNSVLTEEQVAYVVDVQELQSLLQKEAS